MSPESYGWDVIEAAEELYILDGCNFEQVAERTGVSVSQLKRWSADSVPSWPDRKREYREAQVSVRRGVMLAKAKLIGSVLESEDPQKAYAFASLVSSGKMIDQEARDRVQAAPQKQDIAPALSVASDPVEGLRQAVKAKMAALVNQPGALTLGAIKDLMQAMELIERKLATRNDGPDANGQAMTPEQLQAEIRKVYGI